jgi:hypothetical protein
MGRGDDVGDDRRGGRFEELEDDDTPPFDAVADPIRPLGMPMQIARISSAAYPSSGPAAIAGIEDMLRSQGAMRSIIPSTVSSKLFDNPKMNTFQCMEYTRVKQPSGGYREFGSFREGDIGEERVTEKRFQRMSAK